LVFHPKGRTSIEDVEKNTVLRGRLESFIIHVFHSIFNDNNVGCIGGMRNAYKISVGRRQRKRPLGRWNGMGG
jgi:hypothetical protein